MLDEPKDPNLSETPEEPAAGSGFSPEPSQPKEMTPGSGQPAEVSPTPAASQTETGGGTPPARPRTGSLFQRFTGTLRRVTGPLRDTGALTPLEDQPASDMGQLKRTNKISTGRLSDEPGDEAESLQKPTGIEEALPPTEPLSLDEPIILPPTPMPGSRREVPDSGIGTASLPDLEEEPFTGAPGEPETSRQDTGQLRSEGEASPAKPGTGSLIERVTGTLRRVTGSLRDTGSLLTPPGQPTQEAGKTGPLPTRRRQSGPDYVSDLRKALTNEEEADKTKRGTGSLIQRITGQLRRVTGSLRPTDALPPAPPEPAAVQPTEPEAKQPDIADDFLSDRLAGSQVSELPTFEEAQLTQVDESWGEIPEPGPASGLADEELLYQEDQQAGTQPQPEIFLGDIEPMRFTESEAPAAPEGAPDGVEEAKPEETEFDWVAEMRREAEQPEEQPPAPTADENPAGSQPEQTRPEQPEENLTGRRGSTGNLRSFITGVLGRSAAKDKQAEETEISDDLVAGRLGRSLGTEAPPVAEPKAEEAGALTVETGETPGEGTEECLASPLASPIGEPPQAEEEEPIFSITEEESPLLEGLEVSFSHIEGVEEPASYELQPEDEDLLWGDYTAGTETPAGEDMVIDFPAAGDNIWGGNQPGYTSYGAELRQEIWGDEVAPEVPEEREHPDDSGEYVASDEYTAAYSTGEGLAQGGEAGEGALEQPAGEEKDLSPQDLRSIALEDYEEGEFDYDAYKQKINWDDETAVLVSEPAAASAEALAGDSAKTAAEVEEEKEPLRVELQAEEIQEPVVTGDWRSRLAAMKTSQKLLLAEGALVVLALLVAVPFFIFMIIRGPNQNAGAALQGQSVVNSPYPTGLTLPGGWFFPLQTSTLTNGKWQPTTGEWLVGSEVRRVVALPWNKQTEAVIKTFQAGDRVEIQLSDNSTQKYKVSTIERVPVENTKIFSDIRPSLVIILFEEKNSSRWVVVCRP